MFGNISTVVDDFSREGCRVLGKHFGWYIYKYIYIYNVHTYMNIEESYVLCLTSAEDRSARLAYLLLPLPLYPASPLYLIICKFGKEKFHGAYTIVLFAGHRIICCIHGGAELQSRRLFVPLTPPCRHRFSSRCFFLSFYFKPRKQTTQLYPYPTQDCSHFLN